MMLGRPRWGRLSLTQVEITLARLKLFFAPGCTFLFAPRQGQIVLTQYPFAQKCKPLIRRSFSNSRWMRTALFPFRKPIV